MGHAGSAASEFRSVQFSGLKGGEEEEGEGGKKERERRRQKEHEKERLRET